jgi:hypothetical protein
VGEKLYPSAGPAASSSNEEAKRTYRDSGTSGERLSSQRQCRDTGNINDMLDDAIRADIQAIRDILITGMVQDPVSKGVFEERLARCLKAGISDSDLFASVKGPAINNNAASWIKDYYAKQRTKFYYHSFYECLEHLKKVGKKLYPSAGPAASSSNEEAKRTYRDSGTSGGERDSQRLGFGIPLWLILLGIGAATLAILLFILLG